MMTMTFTTRHGDVVVSKDGKWPTHYANLTQATKAAEKFSGEVIRCLGRGWYVRLEKAAEK